MAKGCLVDISIPPFKNDVRRFYAIIKGNDTETILKTIVTLRSHGVLIYNCKQNVKPDLYGEIPNSIDEYFFITPENSQLVNVYIKNLGTRTIIVLPDKFQFLYDNIYPPITMISLVNPDDIVDPPASDE